MKPASARQMQVGTMKKFLFALLITMSSLPTQAQLFSREALGGAALGGLAGGIIGHNNGRRTAEGVGIGAGAGLLIGALVGESRRERSDYYYSPQPSYYRRPNYAVTGAVLGGVAGGVIGHNSGRRTAEGIAIGAGAGLLLGGVAEYSARREEAARATYQQPVYVSQSSVPATLLTTTPVVTQTVQHQPQQVTIINNYYGPANPGPLSSANALFGR
jgi:outer membrane lipoprotein SlyB